MIRLIELVGVRHLEANLSSAGSHGLPKNMSPRTFAAQVANVNFGTSDDDLILPPITSDASDSEILAHETRTQSAERWLQGDLIASEEARIGFFMKLGFDVTNDERRLARCSTFFTRVIEAASLGWLPPCPNPLLEKWRRMKMRQVPSWQLHHANDDDSHHAWVSGHRA